ncbi:MAG TPA: RNase adapter RapZ [Dongiaceae bacterium]
MSSKPIVPAASSVSLDPVLDKAKAKSSDDAIGGIKSAPRHRLVFITGMAGAGRSTALKCLEDCGYEAVDNLPLALAPHLVSGLTVASSSDPRGQRGRLIAIGIDARTRDFTIEAVTELLDQLRHADRLEASLVFMDCDDEILQRRFTETRRRHPLAPESSLQEGIQRERRMMAPLRHLADLVIDTSDQSSADLKRLLQGRFAREHEAGLVISVVSFSFRRGLPREADLVFDVRFLANPYYDPLLRPLTGEDDRVGAVVAGDPAFDTFFAALTGLLLPLLPGYEREGKSYLTLAIGCTGGQHRSVYVARRVAAWLRQHDREVTLTHRDMERH